MGVQANSYKLQAYPNYDVLYYVPNVIGYTRLFLLLGAFCVISISPAWFVLLYSISITLDFVDGYAARKFNQCSMFGAWLDVFIDNISRGLVWVHIHPMFYLVSVIEWTAFVCNHSMGADWKDRCGNGRNKTFPQKPPPFIAMVFRNGFRNFLGSIAITGLHVLPIWMIAMKMKVFVSHFSFLPQALPMIGLTIFAFGRFVCFVVEFWTIWTHLETLLMRKK